MVVTEELLGTSNNARFRAISALAERAVAAARARVCPRLGTALMPDGDARSFAGSHTDSTLSAFKRAQSPSARAEPTGGCCSRGHHPDLEPRPGDADGAHDLAAHRALLVAEYMLDTGAHPRARRVRRRLAL